MTISPSPALLPPLPPFASYKPTPRSTPAIDSLTALLGTDLRVSVPSTHRVFFGTFVCIDKQGNLVLDHTTEWESTSLSDISNDSGDENGTTRREGRQVGLVLIKKQHWGAIERFEPQADDSIDAGRTRVDDVPDSAGQGGNDHLLLKVVNVLAFLFLFSSNLYGGLSPHGTGRETAFTPASYVFWTWTLIDFLLLGYVVYQFFDPSHDAIHGVGYRFALVGILNSIFIHVFVTRHYIVAFIFALLVASTVSTVYYTLAANYPPKGLADVLFVHLPFSLWHAWSIVTVLISAFALFTHAGHYTHPSVLTRILVCVALAFLAVTSVGYAFRSRSGDLAGAVVLAWTIYGVFDHQVDKTIHWFALVAFVVSLVAIVKSLYFTFVARDNGISLGSDSERQPLVN
ncbi:hypothetical protein JCM10212_003479 [Sporobolomyces blumeae]